MKLKNNLIIASGCCLLFLAACQSPKERILGKWQVESFQNPTQDSMMKAHEHSIDTISRVDSTMAQFLGTYDLDSVKAILKKQMTDRKKMEEDAAKQSSMDFYNDSTVVIVNGINVDTAIWSMTDDGKKITFSPPKPQPQAQSATFDIETLTSHKLKLKINRGESTLYINLRPFTKEDSVAAAKLNQEQLQEQLMQQKMQQQMQAAQQQQQDADSMK